MHKSLIIIILLSVSFASGAQIIKNKVDLSAGYGTGAFIGDHVVRDGKFQYASLYGNFEDLKTVFIKCVFRKDQYINFGASFNYYGASGWNFAGHSDFKSSNAHLYAFSPLIQIHNKSAGYGFLNRTTFYLETAPVLGLAAAIIPNHSFTVENLGYIVNPSSEESDLFCGLRGAAGVSISVNQFTGLFLESGGGFYLINPGLYADKSFSNFYISAGVKTNLVKDKRFFY